MRSRLGLVFDLDGTLADTLPDIMNALNTALIDCGLAAVPEVDGRILIGGGARRMVERVVEPQDAETVERVFGRFMAYYGTGSTARSRVYDGVAERLAAFAEAGFAMGVCTNKPGAISERVLAGLGLAEYFTAIVGGDALAVRKPDPAHLLETLARLAVDPESAIMVGDSAADVGAAQGAGVRVVVVDYGYSQTPADRLGADAVISGFAELPGAIATLGRG